MGPRPFPMKETLKEYLQELKDRAVLDEEAIRDGKEREDAYKIEMADKIKFDVDAEEEPEEKDVSDDAAKKMEDGAKDIEKDAEVVKEEKKVDDSEKKTEEKKDKEDKSHVPFRAERSISEENN